MEPTVKGGDGARRTEVGGSEGDSASEEEEKGLLGPDKKSSAGPHELGKRLSEARRSAGRRVRR